MSMSFSSRPQAARHPARLALALLLAVLAPTLAMAQDEKADEERELPDPLDVKLDTKDKVVIKGTYFEPLEPSKSTVPIILLHGWGGNRREYDVLGRTLQEKYNHAVISIDLRGHGGSTVRRAAGPADDVIDPERMSKQDFLAMVYDVNAAKKFLVNEHIKGNLNIELLTVVGADMGAIVALNYAAFDWQPERVHPMFKKKQDVLGLVLLSPPNRFKSLSRSTALTNPAVRSMSTMIIVGADGKAMKDASSLHTAVKRFHAQKPRDAKPDWTVENQDLFMMKPKTTLQGTKLLVDAFKTDQMVAKFIELRLTNKADDRPWRARQ